MKKIILGNGKGKTEQLIRMSDETGHYIVCASMHEADAIHQRARVMGLKIPLPITYREFVRGEYSAKGIKGFLIDDVERLVISMTTVYISAITLTDNEE